MGNLTVIGPSGTRGFDSTPLRSRIELHYSRDHQLPVATLAHLYSGFGDSFLTLDWMIVDY